MSDILKKSRRGCSGCDKCRRRVARPADISVAQFCFSIPPFERSFAYRLDGPVSISVLLEHVYGIVHKQLLAQHAELCCEKKTEGKESKAFVTQSALDVSLSADSRYDPKQSKRRKFTRKEIVEGNLRYVEGCYAQLGSLRQFESALNNVEKLMSEKVMCALCTTETCEPSKLERLTPNSYRRLFARISTEVTDVTGIIQKKSHHILLRKPGYYEFFYRDTVFFVSTQHSLFPTPPPPMSGGQAGFSFVAFALFAIAPCGRKAELIPHTVSVTFPVTIGNSNPSAPLGRFSYDSPILQYPSASAILRTCKANTRVALVVVPFSNVPFVESVDSLPTDRIIPFFYAFDGVITAKRLSS